MNLAQSPESFSQLYLLYSIFIVQPQSQGLIILYSIFIVPHYKDSQGFSPRDFLVFASQHRDTIHSFDFMFYLVIWVSKGQKKSTSPCSKAQLTLGTQGLYTTLSSTYTRHWGLKDYRV
uniref:Uncharacterized protein n=1 Tax=Cacopsylla melanoneura TaxID=428564 RepID=A0A8D8M225_9HEMI